jgi:flagellar protein FlaF
MQTSTSLAQKAYAPASPATHTARDVEYHAFAYVTGLMASAKDDVSKPGGFAKLSEAMFENLRLWLTLAADVAEDANQLPRQTRAQIISLANFTRTHMDRVLSKAATVDPLIEVNLAIMKGLSGDAGGESGVA